MSESIDVSDRRERRPFPTRPDHRRQSPPELHRRIADWLRRAAEGQVTAKEIIDQYRSYAELTK
jgi:hypothetical protein